MKSGTHLGLWNALVHKIPDKPYVRFEDNGLSRKKRSNTFQCVPRLKTSRKHWGSWNTFRGRGWVEKGEDRRETTEDWGLHRVV